MSRRKPTHDDLTPAERRAHAAMVRLHAEGKVTLQAVADELGTSKVTVLGHVQNLVAKGAVTAGREGAMGRYAPVDLDLRTRAERLADAIRSATRGRLPAAAVEALVADAHAAAFGKSSR